MKRQQGDPGGVGHPDEARRLSDKWKAEAAYTSDRGYAPALLRCARELEACQPVPPSGAVPAAPMEDRALAVTRFEVIDETGRVLIRKPCEIELSFQDQGRTLKVFTVGGRVFTADQPAAVPAAQDARLTALRDQHLRSAQALEFGADSKHLLTGEHAARARFEARLHRAFASELSAEIVAVSHPSRQEPPHEQ